MSINRSRVANNHYQNFTSAKLVDRLPEEHSWGTSLIVVRSRIHCSEFLRISPNLSLSHSLDNRALCAPTPIRTRWASDHDCSPSVPVLRESETRERERRRGKYRRQKSLPPTSSRSESNSDNRYCTRGTCTYNKTQNGPGWLEIL